MGLVYSVGSGAWVANAATIWSSGAVPQNTDTVEVRAGHTITIDGEINAIGATTIKSGGRLTPAYAMSTSSFANITVDSGGDLYASRSVSSVLRVAGTITANGTNSVNYGVPTTDPISNAAVGACIEFVCTSDNQASRGIVTGITNAVTVCGATRVMSTTLASLASIGATSIVLTDDMVLRSGTIAQWSNGLADMIVVGHTPIQTANGARNDEIDIYLVGNYVAGTKTVTLADAGAGATYWPRGGTTPNWNDIHQTARQVGTPVWLVGSNVVFRGSAYNLRPSRGIDCGATTTNYAVSLTNAMLIWMYRTAMYGGSGSTMANCVFAGNYASVGNVGQSYTMSGCIFVGGDSTSVEYGRWFAATSCVLIGGTAVYGGYQHTFTSCTFTGNSAFIDGYALAQGHVFSSCNITNGNVTAQFVGGLTFISCTISGMGIDHIRSVNGLTMVNTTVSLPGSVGILNSSGVVLIGCTISANTGYGSLQNVTHSRLYNTALTASTEHSGYGVISSNAFTESFDHDQQAGAYRAWTAGGVVNSVATPVPTGYTTAYNLIPESATYAVFWQRQFMVEAGAYIEATVNLRKDAAMTYLPRFQIVDVFADPLVLATNAALDEFVMTDSTNAWEPHVLRWVNSGTTPRWVYIRAQAKNASGNVYATMDTESVDVAIETNITNLVASIGTPVALDSGTATIAGMLTKLADDSGGSAFDATTDSLAKLADTPSGLTAQETRDAMKLAPSAGAAAAGSVDAHLDSVAVPGDAMTLTSGERTSIGTAVWAATTRTLTSLSALVADIAAAAWAYATRTLTQSAASVTSAVAGSDLTVTKGVTFSATLTGLGNISARTKLYFTAKRTESDADSAAIVQIEESAGCVYFNGAAGTAGYGSLTVNDATTGSATIALTATATKLLTARSGLRYDLKMVTASAETQLTEGDLDIDSAVTLT